MARHRLGVLIVPLVAVSLAAGAAGPTSRAGLRPPARPVPGVAWWARPSDTGQYVGYSVGGGCLCAGDAPAPDQGTWGWDYGGLCRTRTSSCCGAAAARGRRAGLPDGRDERDGSQPQFAVTPRGVE